MTEEKIQAFLEKFKDVPLEREPIIDTGREPLPLERMPADLDFVKVIGGTTYTVRSHFNPDAEEDLLQIICRLMYGDPNLRRNTNMDNH